MQFELMVHGRREPVLWSGESGEDAAVRYVDVHRDRVVVAWRRAPGPLVTVLGNGRIEG